MCRVQEDKLGCELRLVHYLCQCKRGEKGLHKTGIYKKRLLIRYTWYINSDKMILDINTVIR